MSWLLRRRLQWREMPTRKFRPQNDGLNVLDCHRARPITLHGNFFALAGGMKQSNALG
jgi:hypothetical protein